MTDYFIGDIQGCFEGLQKALANIEFSPGKDTLWLTGDLIARGEDSLATLNFLTRHESAVRTVLGNHDLHFLAVANKIKPENPKDNLSSLLNSKKLSFYCDWLRNQPLLLELPDNSGFMSHAGLPPDWDSVAAEKWASQLHNILKAQDYVELLKIMYANNPAKWTDELSHQEQLVYSVNGLTRMRYCSKQGTLDFAEKCVPSELSTYSDLIPWFEFQSFRFDDMNWVFGHWAALMGHANKDNIYALDTGYVWGNYLTVLNWQSKERALITAKDNLR